MDKVVYILGAGFSAPLGLPVMSNFIFKAKDMYFKSPKQYGYFQDVFHLLNQMSVIKNYFKSDLFNIEETLSILEMNDYLSEKSQTDLFTRFLSDVIQYYTPTIPEYREGLPSNWYDWIFGTNSMYAPYGFFLANVLNLSVDRKDNGTILINRQEQLIKSQYSIITLNYDLVLENMLDHLRNNYDVVDTVGFRDSQSNTTFPVYLAKLHGCVDKGSIVPPTWNKSSNEELRGTWTLAKNLLKEANHIRILGYSLPQTDSYMKYLFKSAMYESEHLKSVDVITLDQDGTVKRRYDEFIYFNYYNFKHGNIVDYLSQIREVFQKSKSGFPEFVRYDHLEVAHEAFMSK
ncbi:SIR2 family protein [Brevibacillus centrosporus]|uniref:SIR2 family protein n=1 Tax=Brevibacillus centrosporus TaxID=54910 RepID=UPI002E248417|nr:SIR2 family protein [Brevibacillus centrosporus]